MPRFRAAGRAIVAAVFAAALVGAGPAPTAERHDGSRGRIIEPAPAPPAERSKGIRERIVEAARRRLGRRFRGDCSGFVLAALGQAGVAVRLSHARSRSESLYRASRPTDAPLPGDLAFFDNTYDRNHDGRANDRFTHVALVETVQGATATLLHRGVHGVERIRIDTSRPSDPEANDPVRLLRKRDPPRTRVLAGELFTRWGSIVPAREPPRPGGVTEAGRLEPAASPPLPRLDTAHGAASDRTSAGP